MRVQRLVLGAILLTACAEVDGAVLGALATPAIDVAHTLDAAVPPDAAVAQPLDAALDAAQVAQLAGDAAEPDAAFRPTDASASDAQTRPDAADSGPDSDDQRDAAVNPLCVLEPWHCTP